MGIANQKTIRFDDRQSLGVHGMSSKKIPFRRITFPSLSLLYNSVAWLQQYRLQSARANTYSRFVALAGQETVVGTLIQILLGGTPLRSRNHHLWIQAVQDYFDGVLLCVPCCQLLRFVCETAPQQGCKVYLAPLDGSYHVGDLEALCRGSVLSFLTVGSMCTSDLLMQWWRSASDEDPPLVNIDCTGVGGYDLGGFKKIIVFACALTSTVSQFMTLQ